MTADIVNLRRARKAKRRVSQSDEAAANRAEHGRTRTEREAQALETARVVRVLDGHRIAPLVPDGD